MKNIVYSLHLQFRLKFRKIPQALPKKIFQTAKERYFDNQTQKLIAISEVPYKGKVREMALTYEEKSNRIDLITVHPLKNFQKLHRIKSGRWLKI